MEIGINLNKFRDWSPEFWVNDFFKQSRGWLEKDLNLTISGWVRSLKPGQTATTLLFSPQLSGEKLDYPKGPYNVYFRGNGTFKWSDNIKVLKSARGYQLIELLEASGDGIYLTLESTNPNNYLKDIKIRSTQPSDRSVFYKPFLNSLNNDGFGNSKGFKTIRFLFLNPAYNNLPQAHLFYKNLPKTTDAFWTSKGPPVEGPPLDMMISLCNTLNANPWFCIPHMATDSFVRVFAKRIKDKLNPNLKVYIEHANEVWNPGFEFNDYSIKQGLKIKFSTDPFEAGLRYHAWKSVRIFNEFERIFADNSRLVRVLAGQTGVTDTYTIPLSFRDTAEHCDILATGAYIGYELRSPEMAEVVSSWGLDQLFEATDALLTRLKIDTDIVNNVAKQYKLPLVAYEGGQHLHNGSNKMVNDLFSRAQHDPRMGDLITSILKMWNKSNLGLFCYAYSCSDKAGHWGLLENLDNLNTVKYQALQKFVREDL